MAADELTNGAFMLGDVRIDVARGKASYGGEHVHLEPKVVEALLALVGASGMVLERAALIDEVWPDGTGGDESLTRVISILRRTLAMAPGGRDYIETVPKRGYRLAVEAVAVDGAPVAQSPRSAADPNRKAPGARSRSNGRNLMALAFAATAAAGLSFLGPVKSPSEALRAPATPSSIQQSASLAARGFEETAGAVIVVADVNIANPLDGFGVAPTTRGNAMFFSNILGDGDGVVIQKTANKGSEFIIAGAGSIATYYRSLPGVSAKLLASHALVSGTDLSNADLFVSFLPSDAFTAGEIRALDAFVKSGGTILFLGDSFDYDVYNTFINGALAALNSHLIIQHFKFDQDFRYAAGDQIADHALTAGIDRFAYATVNTVLGGEPLFRTIDGTPFAVVEVVSSP